jgi:hypothetical protein
LISEEQSTTLAALNRLRDENRQLSSEWVIRTEDVRSDIQVGLQQLRGDLVRQQRALEALRRAQETNSIGSKIEVSAVSNIAAPISAGELLSKAEGLRELSFQCFKEAQVQVHAVPSHRHR